MADLDQTQPTHTMRDTAHMTTLLQCQSQSYLYDHLSAPKAVLLLHRAWIPASILMMNTPKSSPRKDLTSADLPPSKDLPLSIAKPLRCPTAARTLFPAMSVNYEHNFVLPTGSIPAAQMSSVILPMIRHSIVAARIVHMVRGVLALLQAKEVLPVEPLATLL